jgi:hypothetical protein
MSVEYNEDIKNQILSHLDGWETYSIDPQPKGEVQPFIDNIAEYQDNPNKRVSETEVENFYNIALDKSLAYCNRLNVDDLSTIEEQMFVKGVCLLAASDLWNKFNVRVNNEDLEDVYVQSYGGLLYKQAVNILHSFINQRVTTLSSLKRKNEKCDKVWLM